METKERKVEHDRERGEPVHSEIENWRQGTREAFLESCREKARGGHQAVQGQKGGPQDPKEANPEVLRGAK